MKSDASGTGWPDGGGGMYTDLFHRFVRARRRWPVVGDLPFTAASEVDPAACVRRPTISQRSSYARVCACASGGGRRLYGATRPSGRGYTRYVRTAAAAAFLFPIHSSDCVCATGPSVSVRAKHFSLSFRYTVRTRAYAHA